jgi:hypothetical protein
LTIFFNFFENEMRIVSSIFYKFQIKLFFEKKNYLRDYKKFNLCKNFSTLHKSAKTINNRLIFYILHFLTISNS